MIDVTMNLKAARVSTNHPRQLHLTDTDGGSTVVFVDTVKDYDALLAVVAEGRARLGAVSRQAVA